MGTTSDFYISRDNGDMLWIGGTHGDGYQIAEADGDDLSPNDKKNRTRSFMAHEVKMFQGKEKEYIETVLEFLHKVCEEPMIDYFNHGFYDGQVGNPCNTSFIYVYKDGRVWVNYHTIDDKLVEDNGFSELNFTPTVTFDKDEDGYLLPDLIKDTIKLRLPTSSDRIQYLNDKRKEYSVWMQGDSFHPEPSFIGTTLANNLREACEILIENEIIANKNNGKYRAKNYDAHRMTYGGCKLYSSEKLASK